MAVKIETNHVSATDKVLAWAGTPFERKVGQGNAGGPARRSPPARRDHPAPAAARGVDPGELRSPRSQ
ncbi:MAG TPA: hypothetical protein VFS26_06595 [Solirubrobacterales bacterium]|nr:hypothetical protein [Solirubrobacterales bacterium]